MLRILHVDDSETDLELTRIQLVRHDRSIEIDWANSGEEALKKIESEEYDCILSDFQMPGLDGLELLKEIRQAEHSTPFIFLTGQGNEDIASEALRAGADDYYTKEAGLAHYQRLINSIRRVVDAHTRRSREQQAKQALQESEEKYRNLVVRANDLIVIVQDELIKFANPKMGDLLGYTVDEAIDTPYAKYIWPDERERIADCYSRRLLGKSVDQIYESALMHRDGHRIDVEINAGLIELRGKAADLVFLRDITERKRAQVALRESEERYRVLLEESNDPIFSFSSDGTYLYVNRAFAEGVGRPIAEIISRQIWDVFPKEEADQRFAALSQVFSTGEEKAIEVRVPRADGDRFYITTITPIKDSQGKVTSAICSSKDITERKRAEEALRHSEERYRNFVTNASEGIFCVEFTKPIKIDQPIEVLEREGAEYAVTGEVNEALAAMYKLRPEEMTGRPVRDFSPNCGKNIAELLKAEGFRAKDREQQEYADDGSVIHIVESYFGIVEGGFLIRVWGVQRDITERVKIEEALKESEETYRTTLMSVGDAVIATDEAGRITRMNPVAESLTGWSQADAQGKPLKEVFRIISEDTRAKVENPVERILREGLTIGLANRTLLITRDGTEIPIADSGAPIRDDKGRTIGVVLVFRNQTKERMAANALRRSEASLAEAQKIAKLGSWERDMATGEGRWSVEMFRLTGFDPAAGVPNISEFLEWVHPQDRQFFEESNAELAKTGKSATIEYRSNPTRGPVRYFLSNVNKLDGKLVGTFQEITERKLAEAALQESEKNYRNLVERANDVIFIIQDNLIVFVNHKITDLLGYSPDELLNTLSLHIVHPDYREQLYSNYQRRMQGEPIPPIYETAMLHKNGSKVDIELNAGIIEFRGKPADLLIMRDITERKLTEAALRQSEERLALALDAATDGLWDWDVPSGKTYFSPRYYTMLGYEPDEFPAEYQNWVSLLHQDDRESAMTQVERMSQPGHDSFLDEFRMRTKSGQWRWILSRGKVAERGPDGKPVRIVGTHVDISGRKQAEGLLAESEAKNKAILEASIDGILIADIDSKRFTYANSRICEMLGYSREELLQMSVYDIHPEASVKDVIKAFEAQNRGEMTMAADLPCKRKDGSIFYVDIAANTAFIGGQAYQVGFFHDITEKKESENRLRELERERSVILDNMIEHVVLHDTEMRVVWANKTACDSVHSSLEDLVGRHCYEIWRTEAKEPCPDCPIPRAVETGEICSGEMEFPDGGVWLIQGSPVKDETGKVIRVVETSIEITERRRAEQAMRRSEARLRSIFEAAESISFILTDLDQTEPHIIEYSPGSEQIYGYSREEALGMPVYLLHPPEEIDKVRRMVADIRDKNIGFQGEISCVRKDGSTFPGVLYTRAITDDEGNVLAALGVSYDISSRKQAEENIKNYTEQLELRTQDLVSANKELEAFSYSVSHDLRAPLRHILGFTDLLLQNYGDKLDSEGREYLERVGASSQNMSDLIDGMLKLSRLSRAELTRERVNLSQLASSIADKLRKSRPDRNVRFEIAEGAVSRGDLHLLHSVLENLLGNAFKFTAKKKEALIEFGAEKHEDRTVFFVRDNGTGFSPKDAAKIFIPFSRLHPEAEFEGTGIGLATVQRIVRRHGGDVWAEGKPGKGATFYFTLG